MAFSIGFINQVARPGFAYATIKIGEFEERFEVDLSYWSTSDYQRQWREAIRRATAGEAVSSCLIGSLSDPESANFVIVWPIYLVGSEALFQSRVLFMDEVVGRFDPFDPYGHVGGRQVLSTEGEPVSEWNASIEDLREFLNSSRDGDPG